MQRAEMPLPTGYHNRMGPTHPQPPVRLGKKLPAQSGIETRRCPQPANLKYSR
jgi:hypothetical protein